MVLYRVKQFYRSITSKITDKDIEFYKQFLNKNEIGLFRRLSINEQKHSINVARDVKEECKKRNIEDRDFIKAALLHDIGKIYTRLNAVDKSIMVVLNKITKGKIKRMTNVKKIDIYYNHSEKGYELLKSLGLSDKVLNLVRNHHSNKKDMELEILRKCDDSN